MADRLVDVLLCTAGCGRAVDLAWSRRTGLTAHPPCTKVEWPTAEPVQAPSKKGQVQVHDGKPGPKPPEERLQRPAKLTSTQRHRLDIARTSRTLAGAATDLGMKPQALERALYRIGEHELVSKLKGAVPTPADGASVTGLLKDRQETGSSSRAFVSGGREKRTLTPDEVAAWQAARRRVQRAQPAPRYVKLASGTLAEGVVVSDADLDAFARRERVRAVEEARATFARVRRA